MINGYYNPLLITAWKFFEFFLYFFLYDCCFSGSEFFWWIQKQNSPSNERLAQLWIIIRFCEKWSQIQLCWKKSLKFQKQLWQLLIVYQIDI